MLTFLTIALLLMAAMGIGYTLRSLQAESVRADYVRVLRAIRWWMVPLSVASLTGCLTVGITLLIYGPQWMQWGWWAALGGQGNVYAGQTENQGVFWSLTAWAIPVSLAIAVPLLARQEEMWFRYGTEAASLGQTLARSLLFGLAHLVAGVPFAAALALSIPGLVFATVYRVSFDGSRTPVPVSAPTINWSEYEAIPDLEGRLAWLEAEVVAEERRSRHRGDWEASQREARERATDVAAAAHTVSNWCALGLLVVLGLGS